MLKKYLKALFRSNEWVNVCKHRVTETRACARDKISGVYQWVCVNPLRPHSSRKRANLSAFRNFVIEFDDMDKDLQMQYAKDIGLPYALAVFSGNRSIHFIISMARDLAEDEYLAFARRLKRALPQADPACLEPARLTRCPGPNQPVVGDFKKRTTPSWLNTWLISQGAPEEESFKPFKIQPMKTRMTRTAMELLSGTTDPTDAHKDTIHTARVLFEMGMEYEQVVGALTTARQLMRQQEAPEYSEERTRKVVDWVQHTIMEKAYDTTD